MVISGYGGYLYIFIVILHIMRLGYSAFVTVDTGGCNGLVTVGQHCPEPGYSGYGRIPVYLGFLCTF